MDLPPSDLPPQKLLAPRRKRALLSFRRKTDIAWFMLSLMMFSAGGTALVFAFLYLKGRGPFHIPVASLGTVEKSPPAQPVAPPLTPADPLDSFSSLAVSPTTPPSKGGEPATPLAPRRPYVLLKEAGLFKTLADKGTKVAVAKAIVSKEPVARITYDLTQGEWVQCYLDLKGDFRGYSRVKFIFSGEGSANTLELKLVDSDGSNVGTSWPNVTSKAGWTAVDVALRDLFYLWGGDATFDWQRVRQIFFAVSKKRGDQGGQGRVTLRGIEFS